MAEEDVGGRGLSGASFGGLLLILLAAVVVVACLIGLPAIDSIEGSRADRAQANAAAQQAQAGARAAEARSEVDKVQIAADSALALQVERHEYALAAQAQEIREFQDKLLMYAIIIERLDKRELARLEAQMNAGRNRVPVWAYVVAALLAVWVFVLALLGLRLWQSLRYRRGQYD